MVIGSQVHPGKIRTIVFLFMAALAVAGCGKDEKGGNQEGAAPAAMAMPVTVVEAKPTSVPISAEVVAQTEGAKEVEIRPRVGGILLKRLYDEGEEVKEGDAMFLIDPEPYKIALAQARAALAEQTARIEKLKRTQIGDN